MKKLLVAAISFAALAVSTTTAGMCQHGHPVVDEADDKAELIAQEIDLQLLELLEKQREDKEEQDHSSYN